MLAMLMIKYEDLPTLDLVLLILTRVDLLLGIGALIVAPFIVWWSVRRAKRQHKSRSFNSKHLTNMIVIDEVENGGSTEVFIRPRCVQSTVPLLDLFHDQVMVEKVQKAARECERDTCPHGASIVLPGESDQAVMLKDVVQAASAIVAPWHFLRVFNHDAVDVMFCWAIPTNERIGTHGVRMPRTQIIRQEDLRKFLDPAFVESLRSTPGESKHDDTIEMLVRIAHAQYGDGMDGLNAPDTTEVSENAKHLMRYLAIPVPKFYGDWATFVEGMGGMAETIAKLNAIAASAKKRPELVDA